MEPTAPAAPAQPTPTISATFAAASAGSFADFDKADLAARDGKPLAPVAKPAAAAPAAASASAPAAEGVTDPAAPALPERGVSKRQQEINEHIRRATTAETELARLRDENARLKGTAPRTDPAPAVPAAEKFPSLEAWSAQPENEGKSFTDFLDARDEFRDQQRERAATQRQETDQRTRALQERSTRFGESIRKAAETDPDFTAKIPPAVLSARPISALTSEERASATFANVVAEVAFRSDNPAALLMHLHAHQDETSAIASRPPSDWIEALTRLDGRVSAPAPTAPAVPASATAVADAPPSTVTAAPPPAPTLARAGSTTDPQSAAFARGDFAAWDAIESEKERARLVRA